MKSQNFKKFVYLIISVGLLPNSFAMIKALNTAATGMSAQEANVNTISHNIANVNTTGYKRQRAEFETLHYETVTGPGSRSSDNTLYNVGIQIGSGAKVTSIRKEFTQGDAKLTDNPFDLMINGEGFFGIIMPNQQVKYTRDGTFSIDAQGRITTRQGYLVVPTIQVPPGIKSIHIAQDGKVDVYFTNQVEPENLGQIPLFTFINPMGLSSTGENLYEVTEASGPATQNVAGDNSSGVIQQGALETSNVSIMNEMTDLIKAQRSYEMNSKVMGVADQMLQTVNNIR